MSGCADQGFVGTLVNPCNHDVEFYWQEVPSDATTSGSPVTIRLVAAQSHGAVVELPSDFDVLVPVPELGWSERWVSARAGDERTFTIPTELCEPSHDSG